MDSKMEETALVREYRMLATELNHLRIHNDSSAQSAQEDELLDEMDDVWYRMTRAEQEMI